MKSKLTAPQSQRKEGGSNHFFALSTVFPKLTTNATLQRQVTVERPGEKIPDPTGKGRKVTNGEISGEYLRRLCPTGKVDVENASGAVSIDKVFCTVPTLGKGDLGPVASPAQISPTANGCTCLCDMTASKNTWKILIDDASWPHTEAKDRKKSTRPKSGGTGGVVTTTSPNSPKAWGAVTKSGKFVDYEPHIILGHELCGHARMMDTGDHGIDDKHERGKGGHQETVKKENEIRKEHGISDPRGGHRDPYCGESFHHPAGTKPIPGKVTMSGYLKVCEAWRKSYNKLNKTSYTVKDHIPVKAGEKLPK